VNKKRVIIFICFVIVVIIIHYFGIGKYVSLANLKKDNVILQAYIEKNYWISVFYYISIYSILIALGFPVAFVLTMSGGFLFGTVRGALFSNIAATIGSSILFLVIKYLIGGWLHKKLDHRLKTFRRELELYGDRYLLSVHFLSVVPLFIINGFAALANVSFWTFFWTTVVGTWPGFLVYSFAGKQFSMVESLHDVFSWKITLAFLFLVFLSCLPVILRKRRKYNNA